MYELSKDYNKLYELICDGQIVAGFVDYDGCDEIQRDIAMILRHKEFDISILVRGTTYASVWGYERKTRISEQELFIRACQRTNLEWIAGRAK